CVADTAGFDADTHMLGWRCCHRKVDCPELAGRDRLNRSVRCAHVWFPPRLRSGPVWSGDDLEEVPHGVLEVDAAASVAAVDLAFLPPSGVGPEVEAAATQAAGYLVELALAHEERIVLLLNLLVGLEEGERHLVRRIDVKERTERHGRSEA